MNVAELVTVVIVHYRTPDLLRRCLERVELFLPEVPVLVVDADSGDGTLEWLARDRPWVRAYASANHSMASALNHGLKKAESPFILQMNADVFLEANTVPELLGVLQASPDIGMVGPRCRTAQGRWQPQGWLYRRYHAWLDLSRRRSVRVRWLSGCCQLLRREALARVGGMDSSFRFYNEDSEWCLRLRQAGYEVHLVDTAVTHVGGASTPADPRFVLEGLRGGMQLSRRFQPPLYRRAHRQVVLRYSQLASRLSRTDAKRELFAAISRLFRNGTFDESPFGSTLNSSNEAFYERRS